MQDVQHENTVSDIDTEVGEGVGEALHLLTVVFDAEVALKEAPDGGVDMEGVSFTVVEEVVLQGQPGVVSRVAIGGGGAAQKEAAWVTGDAPQEERATGP
jgi:hypothetical protein